MSPSNGYEVLGQPIFELLVGKNQRLLIAQLAKITRSTIHASEVSRTTEK